MQPPRNAALSSILNSDDLVYCLTQLIPSRIDIGSLCLVSKDFNSAFSPALYSHIVFHDGNAHILRDPEQLRHLAANHRLRFTKLLTFDLIEGSWSIGYTHEVGPLVDSPGYGRFGDIRRWAWTYNESILCILQHIPKLVGFEWRVWPISQRLQDHLSEKCSSLRDVFLRYPDLSRFERTERTYRERGSFDEEKPHMIPLPLPAFEHIRALHLYEIHGDLTKWINVISTTLQQSPFIQELGLSISPECERSYYIRKAGSSTDSYYTLLNFFSLLVEDFRVSGARRLALKSLKLGYGVLLNDPGDSDSRLLATPLSEFTDLSLLEEVFIDNDLDVGCSIHLRPELGRLAWRLITGSSMPRLNRFSFTSLSERSRDWLCTIADPGFTGSMTLGIGTSRSTYSYIRHDDGLIQRTNRMSLFNEKTFYLNRQGHHANFPIRCRALLILQGNCAMTDFNALKSCTWLDTLVVCFRKNLKAVVLRKFLSLLPALDNLWIRVGMDYPLHGGGEESVHRGNAVRVADDTLVDEQIYLHEFWRSKWKDMATFVAATRSCPAKYLKIGHLTWRVLPREKGTSASILEPLDRWEDERECPDVFQYRDPVRSDRMY